MELNKKWRETRGNVIADNVDTVLLACTSAETFDDKMKWLVNTTNSSKHAVYAWFNRGREDVKIPFLKLCMIADALNISIGILLKEDFMSEKKFAVVDIVGDNIRVLKLFPASEKKEALAYCDEVQKENHDKAISCIRANFTPKGKILGNYVEFF